MANTHSLDLEASSSQYASITDASQTGLDISGDFTFELWFKPESVPGTAQTFIAKGDRDTSTNNKAFRFYWQDNAGTEQIAIEINQTSNDTTRDIVTWDTSLSTGTWVHIAITCDISQATASTFELFLNSSSQGNGTAAVSGNCASINNSSESFRVGAGKNSGTEDRFLDGLVDEVRVWNDVRTSTEISNNYQSQLNGDEANLVGYWRLDNNYADLTANNNDLTATNSPVFSTDVPFTDISAGGTLDLTSKMW